MQRALSQRGLYAHRVVAALTVKEKVGELADVVRFFRLPRRLHLEKFVRKLLFDSLLIPAFAFERAAMAQL